MKYKTGNLYKIKKIGNVEKPYHENSTFGESKKYHIGILEKEPKIGERFWLHAFRGYEGINTTPIQKIKGNKLYTMNSIYEISDFNN